MTGLSKFDELRTKTDRQVIQLIRNALDTGLRNAQKALLCADDWVVAEVCYRKARAAYADTGRLIRLIGAAPPGERAELESEFEHLGRMLHSLSAIGSAHAPNETDVASLARVLWEARGCPVPNRF